MAVVKKQSEKKVIFLPRPCSRCAQQILEAKDGVVVKLLSYSGAHRSSIWEWAHRKCIVTTGK